MNKITSENILKDLKKAYGEGAIDKYKNMSKIEMDRISTGSMDLNKVTGGGWPLGRIIEIFGPNASGKSTIAALAIKECQKTGKKAVYIDMEHALDPNRFSELGVDLNDMILSQPSYGEQAMDFIEKFCQCEDVGVIILDSVATCLPKKELDGEMGDAQMGGHARLMSQALRKINARLTQKSPAVMFINQIRKKFVLMGNPNTTPGGEGLKFYSSIRIEMLESKSNKDEKNLLTEIRYKNIKNKTGMPYLSGSFMLSTNGVDTDAETVVMAVEKGVIDKKGSWFKNEELNINLQGIDALVDLYKDKVNGKELRDYISKKLK